MSKRTWIIIGATSIIAESFARLIAQEGHALLLVARDAHQLDVIASDLRLRFQVHCETLPIDCSDLPQQLLTLISVKKGECSLFLAHTFMSDNSELTVRTIHHLIDVNVTSTIQMIHTYMKRNQASFEVLFLSSVAACRGRAKNSLYGASKAAIEVYLQGLQQAAKKHQCFTIARLGFIDTKLTYGKPGIFYASSPTACAKACRKAIRKRKRLIYHPFFWRILMGIITRLPFFLYKKIRED